MSTLKFRLVCNCDNKTLPVAKRNVQVATTYNIQEGLRYGRAGLSIFVATPPSCKISSDGNYFKSLRRTKKFLPEVRYDPCSSQSLKDTSCFFY